MGRITYLEYKKKVEFGREEYDYIDAYCREKPLAWTAFPWDIPSLEFLLKFDLPFIKIASASNTDWDLLKLACESRKPLLVSTGMSTLEEVDNTVEFLEKHSEGNYILLHTNSSYPAPASELNLRMIITLKERYHCLVRYSGHEYDLEPTVVTVSLGARVIERHVTLDHNMWGTDQAASLSVGAMAMMHENGMESVFVSRADGQGINILQSKGIDLIIMSTEKNDVVKKRAEKLRVECIQAVSDKAKCLKEYCQKKKIPLQDVAYIGNDINDYDAMCLVGIKVVPNDAHEIVKTMADYMTTAKGGYGVIREIADWIQNRK